MKPKKNDPGIWPKTRKFLNDIHLWAGLISGLVLVVVCFTGTVYVYHNEIREMGAPHLYKVTPHGERMPLDELVTKATSGISGNLTAVLVPDSKKRSVQLSVREENDNSRGGTTYFVNPYSGEVLGTSKDPNKASEWLRTMFSLHRWLMLDRIEEPLIGELPNRTLGSYITGAATILFTFGVLTGIVIWVPKKARYWRQGLKIKLNGNWKRINHDLHNTLAFYSAIILFIMGVTGPFWSFPWYREGLQKTLGTYQEPGQRGGGPGGSGGGRGAQGGAQQKREKAEPVALLDIESYLAATDEHLPYRGDYRVTLPQPGAKQLSIAKTKVGFFAPAASDRVTLDVQDASLKSMDVFAKKPFNERVSSSIKALHVGDVYGGFSKIIYFISCLIATSLPITGTLIWINKMKKKTTRKDPQPRQPSRVLSQSKVSAATANPI